MLQRQAAPAASGAASKQQQQQIAGRPVPIAARPRSASVRPFQGACNLRKGQNVIVCSLVRRAEDDVHAGEFSHAPRRKSDAQRSGAAAFPRVCVQRQSVNSGNEQQLRTTACRLQTDRSGSFGSIRGGCDLAGSGHAISTRWRPRMAAARRRPLLAACIPGRSSLTANLLLLCCRRRKPPRQTVTKLPKPAPRATLRMGLPSKGRMAEDTLQLLKDSALSVYKPNPRQYVAAIPQVRQSAPLGRAGWSKGGDG